MTMVQGPDLTGLAERDRRVARELAVAARDQLAEQQRIAAADAAADRKLRTRQGELRLAAEQAKVKAEQEEQRRMRREAERDRRRQNREQRRKQWASRRDAMTAWAVGNVDRIVSGVIYTLALGGAVYGQLSAAEARGWPTQVGIVIAVAIEGLALVMALTASRLRLDGEAARLPRALTWACAGAAAAINYAGHIQAQPEDEAGAVLLALLSVAGIVVWEIRSGAKHRPLLRDRGDLPDPPERFGWRRWAAYPRQTLAAWTEDVRDRLSPGAAALIARVETRRAERRRQQAAEAERQRRLEAVAAERARQQKVTDEVTRRARQAVRRAARSKDGGAAYAALVALAHTGTPAPTLALPSPSRADAEAARAETVEAHRARVEAEALAAAEAERAEAEAGRRARVEAEAAATVAQVRAEAEATIRRVEAEAAAAVRQARVEAEAATGRAEAEAGRRARVEAEARDAVQRAEAEAHRAMRRAEAEAAATALARQAEAEARAARDRIAAEAEAARTEVRTETARAARAQGQLDSATAEWHRRVQTAEAATAQARRELATEQRARHAAEARADSVAEQAEQLRQALAQAAADGARRPRRTATTVPTEPVEQAEPLLFEGRPVPEVERISPATVLAVLQARKDNPDVTTHKDLAALIGKSDKTVSLVLKAVEAGPDATQAEAA
ncbi:DUF2637 domain-containing protein [Polymorphospora sp. NPDC050346]|uniref:DUF2637 domain-containing protein n=1 Tax=Polymorphospora sp. NPDC050346 TaxID=3155780 RepID=UPI0033C51E63